MPPKQGSLWTTRRKLAGNLIPAVASFPLLFLAIRQVAADPFSPLVVLYGCGFLVVGWFVLNLTGGTGNGRLSRTLALRLVAEGMVAPEPGKFVGFARPAYSGLLDPHEDVGFLYLGASEVEFVGSLLRFGLARSQVTGVRFRPNIHSWLGLGRWVSIEGKDGDRVVRLLVEPRCKRTLLGNRRHGERLAAEIRSWLAEG